MLCGFSQLASAKDVSFTHTCARTLTCTAHLLRAHEISQGKETVTEREKKKRCKNYKG